MSLYAALFVVACLGSALALAVASSQRPACGIACDTVTLALPLPRTAPIERVGAALPVAPVSPGFLGLSIEWYAVQSYAGSNPAALNPVFLQLVRNLNPGQSPVLRIGGDSADWSWLPAHGVAPPAGAKVTITPRLLSVLAALGTDLKARFVLDLDLEADSVAIARDEALASLRTIGLDRIRAFEIGNEPELYDVLGWYQHGGRPVFGRARGYGLGDYEREFDSFGNGLPSSVPLAGPASGQPAGWRDLGTFAATARRLGLVTVHRYPLQRCKIEPGTPQFPTIADLIAPRASTGLANSLVPDAVAAHAHGETIRVDEINSVACFGSRGVSNTFAAALWALETSFATARVGVDGLNFHTLPAAVYRLFSFLRIHGRWFGRVAPSYYGLLTFARAAPAGSKLLRTSVPSGGLPMWATAAPGGTVHVVLVNTGRSARTVGVRIGGVSGVAGLSYLRAPSLRSGSVTLANGTFGGLTSSGVLSARPGTRPVAIQPTAGIYVVRVPSPSAAMLTLSRPPPAG